MAAHPILRPGAGQPGDVFLASAIPVADVYVRSAVETSVYEGPLNKTPPASGAPVAVTGAAAVTLDPFTSSATGDQSGTGSTGTAAVTLDAFTSSASGTETITGTSSQTLTAFTSSATGTESLTGTAVVTLSDATSSATGTETISGTSATTLADSTSTASGTQAENATGTAAITLDPFTSTGVGSGGEVAPQIGGGTDNTARIILDLPQPPPTITGAASTQLGDFSCVGVGEHFIDFDAELEQLLLAGVI